MSEGERERRVSEGVCLSTLVFVLMFGLEHTLMLRCAFINVRVGAYVCIILLALLLVLFPALLTYAVNIAAALSVLVLCICSRVVALIVLVLMVMRVTFLVLACVNVCVFWSASDVAGVSSSV